MLVCRDWTEEGFAALNGSCLTGIIGEIFAEMSLGKAVIAENYCRKSLRSSVSIGRVNGYFALESLWKPANIFGILTP